MTKQPNPEITLTVTGYPPAKSGETSIFSKKHGSHERAIDLLREMKRALADNPGWDRMEERPIGLELVMVETPDKQGLSGGRDQLPRGRSRYVASQPIQGRGRPDGLRARLSSEMTVRFARFVIPSKAETLSAIACAFGFCETSLTRVDIRARGCRRSGT